MIAIVDYKMGNPGSISNMCKKLGVEARITSRRNEILDSDKLILPGVGAFDTGINKLGELDLVEVLNTAVLDLKKPILGICLGFQLMSQSSEEGTSPGLGWIHGRTVRFEFEKNSSLKIPHMGWNRVKPMKENDLMKNLQDPRFYFVHSYHVACNDPLDILTTTYYGHDFVSSIQAGNIFGVQFHPEKSHRYGMTLIGNFARMES